MRSDIEAELKSRVEAFVLELDGRYREHCSNQFLVALLIHELGAAYMGGDKSCGDLVIEGRSNGAYSAGCPVFESILEHGCRAGGNGHHVAQDFERAILQDSP